MNFITGATGLVGSYLSRYLIEQGELVLALKRKDSRTDLLGAAVDKIQWIEGDLMDIDCLLEACEQSNKIYHCAAFVSYETKDKKEIFQTNTKGTTNIVNAALASNIEKLLYVSSIAALGKPAMEFSLNEKAKWENSNFHSTYGLSKYQAEQEVWRGIAEGLNAVIVNPSVILGAGYWHQNSAKLFQYVAKGSKYYSNGSTGFVDVIDVVKTMHLLMKSNFKGERFILNAANLSYKNLFDKIALSINAKAPSKESPKSVVAWLSKLDWLKSKLTGNKRLLTKETVLSAQMIANYKNNKIIDTLDYTFTPIEQTIKQVGQAFLQSKKDGSDYGIIDFK